MVLAYHVKTPEISNVLKPINAVCVAVSPMASPPIHKTSNKMNDINMTRSSDFIGPMAFCNNAKSDCVSYRREPLAHCGANARYRTNLRRAILGASAAFEMVGGAIMYTTSGISSSDTMPGTMAALAQIPHVIVTPTSAASCTASGLAAWIQHSAHASVCITRRVEAH